MKVNPHPIHQLIFSNKSHLFGIIVRTTKTWMIFQPEISSRLLSRTNPPWAGVLILPTQPKLFCTINTRNLLELPYICINHVTCPPSTRVASNDPCLLTNPAEQPLFLDAKLLHIFSNNSTYTLSTWALRGFWGWRKLGNLGKNLRK